MILAIVLLGCTTSELDPTSDAVVQFRGADSCGARPASPQSDNGPALPPLVGSARQATGSSTITAHPLQPDWRVFATSDSGLSVVDDTARPIGSWEAGTAGPARVATLGDKVLATFPSTGTVGFFEASLDGSLELVDEVGVCAEPYGILARADGLGFYVACQLDDAVLELDPLGQERRRWSVRGGPRWLGARADSDELVAVPVRGGVVTRIELARDRTRRGAKVGPLVHHPTTGEELGQLTVRFTGDPSFTRSGETGFIPTMLVDNKGLVVPVDQTNLYYAPPGSEFQRLNPALTVVKGGELAEHQLIPDHGAIGFPASATIDPGGDWLAVAMPAADGFMLAPLSSFVWPVEGDHGEVDDALIVRTTARGTNAVAWMGDHLVANADIDRAIEDMSVAMMLAQDRDLGIRFVGITDTYPLFGPRGDEREELGRVLFNSTVDVRVSDPNNSASCSTCHFDGRSDGLTWMVEDRDVQTPSLTAAAHTGPYTWMEEVDSIAEEARLTATLRLAAPEPADLDAIETFVSTFQPPATPTHDEAAVERGRALFYSARAQCSTCHADEHMVDGHSWRLRAHMRPLNTPTLVGVGATAPYGVDGEAETLWSFIDRARVDGYMAPLRELDCDEQSDLVAFLESL